MLSIETFSFVARAVNCKLTFFFLFSRERKRAGECFRVNNLLALAKYYFRKQVAMHRTIFKMQSVRCILLTSTSIAVVAFHVQTPNAEVEHVLSGQQLCFNGCLHILS